MLVEAEIDGNIILFRVEMFFRSCFSSLFILLSATTY